MNAATFELLDKYEEHWHGVHSTLDYLVKDKDGIYLARQARKFDAETFRILGHYLISDKTGVYYYNKRHSLVDLLLDPETTESYVFEKDYTYYIVVTDTKKAYFINPANNICDQLKIDDLETLEPLQIADDGYVFRHASGLLITHSQGLMPISK